MSVRFHITHPEMIGGPGGTGVLYKAEIEDTQYGGEPISKVVTQTFFEWSYDILDERDPFANPVQKSSFTINLRVESDVELTLLNDILDADEDRFKIHFYIDGTHKWSGKVLTDLIEYPEGPFPFTARITAKDLSNLEGVDYELVTYPSIILTRTIEIIAECLQETGLNLPIRSYTNLTNSEITDQSQDFLYALYHQKVALRNKETPLNCLEVLETICRAYNLLIRQADGRWIIEQLPAVAKGDDVQFDYDSNGENPVSSTPSRTVTIDRSSSFLLPTSQNKITGALHSVSSTYKHRTLIHNISTWDAEEETSDVILSRFSQPKRFSQDYESGLGWYFSMRADISVEPTGMYEIGKLRVVGVRSDAFLEYLDENGNWSQGQTDIEFNIFGGSGSIQIDPTTIPLGVSTIRVEFISAEVVTGIDPETAQEITETADETIWTNVNALIFNARNSDWEASLKYKYTRSGNYSVTEEIPETLLGDGPTSGKNFASKGRPAIDDFIGDLVEPGNFKIRGESGTLTLEELRLRERVSMRRNALRNIRASLWMKYSPENLIEYDGKKWFFLGGRFQAKSSRWDANILLLDYAREAGDVFQTFVEEGGDPSGSSGSGSGGSSGSGISLEQADSRYLQIANDLSEVDAAAARGNLGLGDLATQNTINNSDWSGADLAITHGGTGASSASAARANLGLEIGSDIQAHSPVLDGLASGLTATAAELNRLDGDLATVRGNLGLGTTDDVQFRDLTARNLELTGVINYVNEENLYVEDKTITLNRGGTNASSESAGLIIERPGGNQSLLWNSTDGFAFSDRIKASGANLSGDPMDSNVIFGGNSTGTINRDSSLEPLDGILKSGFYRPNLNPAQLVIHLQHPFLDYAFQIGKGYTNSNALVQRSKDSGVWGEWNEIWTSARNILHPLKAAFGIDSFSGSETLRVNGASLMEGLVTFTDDIIPDANYSGNIGRADRYWLTGRIAELYVPKLVVEEHLSTTGGVFYTGIATVLAEDVSAGATSIKVQNNNLSSGDYIRLYARSQFEVMKVTSGASGSGPYTYSVTRNVDGSGANSWNAGDGIFNTGGVAGFGFIEQYATNSLTTGVSTSGPSVAYQVRTGTGANDIEVRGATGNLKGWYGYTSDVFGAAFGRPDGAHFTIDPGNGFRLRHNTNTLAQLSGDVFSIGGNQGIYHKVGERTRIGTDVDVFGNLAVQSYNQVNNPSVSKNIWGWGNIDIDGSGTSNRVSYDANENALALVNQEVNSYVAHKSIRVDSNKIYRVRFKIRSSDDIGRMYIGIYGRNVPIDAREGSGTGNSPTSEAFRSWNSAKNVVAQSSTNVYFYTRSEAPTDYQEFEVFILGQNARIEDAPIRRFDNGGSSTTYVQPIEEDANYVQVRILNYSNVNPGDKTLFIKDFSITEVDGGLISANTVQTGQLISTNYKEGSGSFSDAGTLIDLDTGNIRSEQFAIVGGSATFAGNIDGATFTGGSATLNTYLKAGNVEIGRDITNALSGGAHNADGLYISDGTYIYGDEQFSFAGGILKGTGGVDPYIDFAGFRATETQLIHDIDEDAFAITGDTTGTGFWGFGVTKTGGFTNTDSFVRMYMSDQSWGFQAYNDGNEVLRLGDDPRISNLTIAGALTMGDTGSILLPSRGIIEGQNSLDDPLWRLEWRGLHLDTSAELEWFADNELGNNSKSVALIQGSGNGGTGASNNQLTLRTAGSSSKILMTTGILEINASVHFTGGALRGAEFFNDATFQNAAIFEPMVINSSTPPSTGWKVGTSSVTGDLVAVHSSGTFRVLASN